MRSIVFAVTVAAVLWVFSSLREHQDRIVRLEEHDIANSTTLREVSSDVKQLLRYENQRAGREDAFDGVRVGNKTRSLE